MIIIIMIFCDDSDDNDDDDNFVGESQPAHSPPVLHLSTGECATIILNSIIPKIHDYPLPMIMIRWMFTIFCECSIIFCGYSQFFVHVHNFLWMFTIFCGCSQFFVDVYHHLLPAIYDIRWMFTNRVAHSPPRLVGQQGSSSHNHFDDQDDFQDHEYFEDHDDDFDYQVCISPCKAGCFTRPDLNHWQLKQVPSRGRFCGGGGGGGGCRAVVVILVILVTPSLIRLLLYTHAFCKDIVITL